MKPLYFIDMSRAARTNLINNFIINKEVSFSDFEEFVPFDFNRLESVVKFIQTSVHVYNH